MADNSICSAPACGKPRRAKGYCRAHYHRLMKHGDPLGGGTSPGELLRFINEVAMHHAGEECLTWPFGKDGDGYGMVRVDGKTVAAHRYICELVHGPPPTPEHQAAHTCGNGHEGCVSPVHLLWKTPAENQADRLVHGTHNRGERHGGAKLTEAAVREILAMKGKETQINLAERFRVSPTLICSIQTGHRWSWLSEEIDLASIPIANQASLAR